MPPTNERRSSLEERITQLEITSLYRSCTHRLIQIYEEEQKREVPKLIETVNDLVKAISKDQNPKLSQQSDTFGVRECAKRLGCSPGFVRTLVHERKLSHIWLGKIFDFKILTFRTS